MSISNRSFYISQTKKVYSENASFVAYCGMVLLLFDSQSHSEACWQGNRNVYNQPDFD